jgi:hypothetical protein
MAMSMSSTKVKVAWKDYSVQNSGCHQKQVRVFSWLVEKKYHDNLTLFGPLTLFLLQDYRRRGQTQPTIFFMVTLMPLFCHISKDKQSHPGYWWILEADYYSLSSNQTFSGSHPLVRLSSSQHTLHWVLHRLNLQGLFVCALLFKRRSVLLLVCYQLQKSTW